MVTQSCCGRVVSFCCEDFAPSDTPLYGDQRSYSWVGAEKASKVYSLKLNQTIVSVHVTDPEALQIAPPAQVRVSGTAISTSRRSPYSNTAILPWCWVPPRPITIITISIRNCIFEWGTVDCVLSAVHAGGDSVQEICRIKEQLIH